MSRTIKRSLIITVGLLLVMSLFCITKVDAASKGIKSAVNVNSGIKVTWYEESGQSGYNIYRRAANYTTWHLVKTIEGTDTLSWIDKKIYNGHKYSYKVISFKDDEEKDNHIMKTVYRLKTPTVKDIYSAGKSSFGIRTNKNAKATGYQINYSLTSGFGSSGSKLKKATTLKAKVTGLKANENYYVRVRAYKTVKGKKYYSAWSAKKTVQLTGTKTAYTTNIWTVLYNKKSSTSSSIKVWYKTALKVLETSNSDSGTWTKVKYLGKNYYMWTDKGSSKLTDTAPRTDYTSSEYNDFQNKILEKALYIWQNWDTKYDYTHKTEDGVPESDGLYAFDCSGLCSYVINTVMQETCPAFELSSSTDGMLKQKTIINDGLKGEISLKTIYDNRQKPDIDKLQPGDLLFFDNNDSSKDIDHVGMYLGHGEFIQSTKVYIDSPDDVDKNGDPIGGVNVAPLKGMYIDDIVKVLRITPQEVQSADIEMQTIKNLHVKIYGDAKCDSKSKVLETLKSQNHVTILYTLKKGDKENAYVRYDGGEGFIYDYKARLEKAE